MRLEDLACLQQGGSTQACVWQQESHQGNFHFEFIPSGRYRLSASTDVQGRGRFCQQGEACGLSEEFTISAQAVNSDQQLKLEVITDR